jgi:hypothetical protein
MRQREAIKETVRLRSRWRLGAQIFSDEAMICTRCNRFDAASGAARPGPRSILIRADLPHSPAPARQI